MFTRLRHWLDQRRAERREIETRRRRRLQAGEIQSDGDSADRNVIGGSLSQRPH